jgi:ubiquinone biosynthesis protein
MIRWYSALAPNIAATLPANTAAETTARAPDAPTTNAAPTPSEAKNAHSCVTPRNRGRTRGDSVSTARGYDAGAPASTDGTARLAVVATRAKQRNLGRLSEIAQVAVRHGFGYVVEGRRGAPAEDGAGTARGRHLREMLDELGPTFVKFGQLLSTRPDIVPPDIIAELRGLQDDVSQFPYTDVERVVREDLDQPIERLFLEFEERAVAAASIGQVHRAVLPNGRRVVVKVQRPNAPRQIEADLALMYQAARLAKERVRALDFIDTREIVDEFARSIRQELDYRSEARNCDTFHRNFAGHPHVLIPRVYWSYTRARVLTLERIDGTQLADLDLDRWTLEQRRRLAYVMADAWMTMIFRHGFFHGDPHPANILVLSQERIGLVDFGLTGKLTDDDMSRLTSLFIDAANENIEALPKRLADLGVKYPKEREEEFVAELRELYHRYYGASLQEIDPIQVIREGFQLIYSMNLRLPTRFVILDKAIATLGSVGIDLYPEFNVFEIAKPYARGLMFDRFRPDRVARRARREGWRLAQMTLDLPYQLHDTLEQVRDGQIEVGFVHKGLEDVLAKLDVLFNRLVIALIVTGGLIGSSLIGILAKSGPHVFGLHVVSALGFLLSTILGIWLLWSVVRSGRI